tara:strand:+ start:610 stop:714 length:105 start_codon:yes stop_codon:yes gene_type:complete
MSNVFFLPPNALVPVVVEDEKKETKKRSTRMEKS